MFCLAQSPGTLNQCLDRSPLFRIFSKPLLLLFPVSLIPPGFILKPPLSVLFAPYLILAQNFQQFVCEAGWRRGLPVTGIAL